MTLLFGMCNRLFRYNLSSSHNTWWMNEWGRRQNSAKTTSQARSPSANRGKRSGRIFFSHCTSFSEEPINFFINASSPPSPVHPHLKKYNSLDVTSSQMLWSRRRSRNLHHWAVKRRRNSIRKLQRRNLAPLPSPSPPFLFKSEIMTRIWKEVQLPHPPTAFLDPRWIAILLLESFSDTNPSTKVPKVLHQKDELQFPNWHPHKSGHHQALGFTKKNSLSDQTPILRSNAEKRAQSDER